VTRVVANQHAEEGKTSHVLTLHDAAGPVLTVTPDHVLYIDGAFAPARNAQPGSILSDGRKVTSVHTAVRGIINPVTASGTILAAHGVGSPVLASTAGEWMADVLLSPYPAYTLSFAAARAFPLSVQQYYDAALEPFFTTTVPALTQLKAAVPEWCLLPILIAGDLFLTLGFVGFVSAKLVLAGVAAALVAGAVRVARVSKA